MSPNPTTRPVKLVFAALLALCAARIHAADGLPKRHAIGELTRTAVIPLGKTADWVAITPDAVWVGSTGPFAVHRIDPKTNRRVATLRRPGNGLWRALGPALRRLISASRKGRSQLRSTGARFSYGSRRCGGRDRREPGQHLAHHRPTGHARTPRSRHRRAA